MISPWQQRTWQQFLWMKNANKIPHAILLNGRLTENFAHLLAGSLFCQQPTPEQYPCTLCKPCTLLKAKTHPDMLDIIPDEKKIKIEAIRDISGKLSYSANQNSWKIVTIIDAHMMTLNAANALLKILEEPPANTVFILTTDAPSSIPATVRSRCEKWNVVNPLGEKASAADEKLLQDLLQFTTKQCGFYDLSQQWVKTDLPSLFHFFFECVADIARIHAYGKNAPSLYFGTKIEAIAPRMPLVKLFAFNDMLQQLWRDTLQVTNLNNALVVETIILNWNEALC